MSVDRCLSGQSEDANCAECDQVGERGVPRRAFLGLALAGAASAAVGAEALISWGQEAPPPTISGPYALVIDSTLCRGDGACVQACRLQNGLPEEKSFIHLVRHATEGARRCLAVQCQHCADPPCATVCPTSATYVRPDGVVMINPKLCVGCKYCMTACPYQARIFDEERGTVDKCALCLDRVREGKPPACVEACVVGARIFGRVDDPDSEVSRLIASGRAEPLHAEFGTQPAILRYIIEE